MQRRTKIVATVGPASSDLTVLRQMIAAGMNMARISLSHGTIDDALGRIAMVREAAAAEESNVGVLADLPGPKVRAAAFAEGGALLTENTLVTLRAALADDRSDSECIAVDLASIVDDVQVGDHVGLGDGGMHLVVENLSGDHATARVVTGGLAQGRPGVTLPPGRTGVSAPTETDLALLAALVGKVDAVAVSFVRSAQDIERARAASHDMLLVAKIETQEAVDALDDVIAAADGVMVARGDLGIRCALEDVPHYQKRIIRTAVAYGRPVITATQMLESMISAPLPTRAEVSDVANAVFDGTSALMLSAETAIGHDPVRVVRAMADIAIRAEQEFDYLAWGRGLGRQQSAVADLLEAPDLITAAVSAAGWRAAVDADVAAIIACTNGGGTARAISRFRPRMRLVAVTPSQLTARQLSVAWGIDALLVDKHRTTDDIVFFAIKAAVERGAVRIGDLVAVLVGSPADPDATTDTLRLVRVS